LSEWRNGPAWAYCLTSAEGGSHENSICVDDDFAGVAIGAGAVQGLHAQSKAPVYVVTETDVTDLNAYIKDYVPLVQATIKTAGGVRLAAGQNIIALEGAPPKARVAINRFDSLDQVKAWRESPEYKEARKISDKYATFRSLAVEGVSQ
jgi:uncharacterized protein (DUF1330 family)